MTIPNNRYTLPFPSMTWNNISEAYTKTILHCSSFNSLYLSELKLPISSVSNYANYVFDLLYLRLKHRFI